MNSKLELRNISVRYKATPALRDVSVQIGRPEIVALIGPNGAGKSTLLRAASRMTALASGSVWLDGQDVTRRHAEELVALGVAHSPEGRRIFAPLTVLENLQLGAFAKGWKPADAEMKKELGNVYELFPVLADRAAQRAGSLSGGEQQMLAIGRALMSRPTVLLLDEPSLGLAPMMVDRIYAAIETLESSFGLAILLVEQDAAAALDVASRGYVLQGGCVVLDGSSAELKGNTSMRELLLGATLSGESTGGRRMRIDGQPTIENEDV